MCTILLDGAFFAMQLCHNPVFWADQDDQNLAYKSHA